LPIEQTPASFNAAALPLKGFPSVRHKNTNRNKSRAFLISRPRFNAPSFFA
jgi:hypothetical protein